MRILGQDGTSRAFALPTVLIASVVLLSILAVSVTATAAVRTALQNQYYVQLAQVAGEAGAAYAKACLAANANVPQWTDAKPLTPATDCAGNLILTPNVNSLIVAGGGSGGGSTGGGGGAGGLIYTTGQTVTATAYPIVVGAGGATASQQTIGHSGSNSSFNGLTAIGGGGGGYSASASVAGAGLVGGSGGGGETYSTTAQAPGAGTAGQGYAGGPGGTGFANGGGGGGAGGAGGTVNTTSIGGPGGAGLAYSITGSMVYYAGGGGGGGVTGGVGGVGGAGTGGKNGTAGVANTGGGGGGGWDYSGGSGGTGGSGVVIISYPTNSGIVASGVLTAGGTTVTPTTSGGSKIFKFVSSGTFTVTSLGTASCPSDPRCSVTVNNNVRSSFTVAKPSVDSLGRALTIPNSGYVEITRESNGAVWRTYKQPSVQAAVVPDLCSGNATAVRGWSSAMVAAQQDAFAPASSAQTITINNVSLQNAGQMYFRKDFNVSTNSSFDFNMYTSSSQDAATAYIDGVPLTSTAGALANASTTLTTGCHVLVVKLVNQTYLPRASDFTASLTRSGAAVPVVVSDATWRVTAGDATHFSSNNYFEAPTAWEPVYVFGIWNNPALPWGGAPAGWNTQTFDPLTEWISTVYSSGGTNRPASSYAWFRQTQPFTLAATTNVDVSANCDDTCDVYLDGTLIFSPGSAQGTVNKVIGIQPGTHTFGVRLFNAASGNVGAFLLTAYDTANAKVLARSNADWDATTSWSSTIADLYSYDGSYAPIPAIQATSNAKVLVVGGGGGGGSDMGGGGGGGGVVYNAAYPLSIGTYTVTPGAGGTGALAGISQARGVNGGNSTFDKLRAYGGGGGGSEYSTNGSPPGAGASAGGSAGAIQTLQATGIIGQGFDSVATLGSYYPTGGGGAGGLGAVNPATGGIGVSNSILGTAYFWGGGGGGSGYTPIGGNGGAGGGGGGAVGVTTGGSGLNAGSPGGGGTQVAQTNKPGGNAGANTGGGGGGGSHYNSNNYGGNGGSGIVVVALPTTGSLSVTTTGVTPTTSGGFTIYEFTSSGTLTINSF